MLTQKETTREFDSISHELTLRTGLAQQVAAGHYSVLPLGQRVVRRIGEVIRQEMDQAGALEVSLPVAQPATLWEESGRWEIYGQEMFRLENRTGRKFCLGPTHEELIVSVVRSRLSSYKQLPFTLYQIGVKFRDELRPRGGLLRAKEFLMKDAYSFDSTDEGANESYNKMRDAYIRIFKRLELQVLPIKADSGEIGGSFSEEFIAPAPAGEDKYVIGVDGVARKLDDAAEAAGKTDVQTGIEIGHIFKLGTRYSEAMGLNVADATGQPCPVIMGCYGIGVSRMIPTMLEQSHDERGIIWPRSVAPYDVVVIPVQYDDPASRQKADEVYAKLQERGLSVLLDDRDLSAGHKFNDANLLGFPLKLIIGPKSLKQGIVECEWRRSGRKEMLNADNLVAQFMRMYEAPE